MNIEILSYIISYSLAFSFLVVALAITIDFLEFDKNEKTKNKKSVVTTGTMFLFFVGFYLLIKLNIGQIEINNLSVRLPLAIIGTVVIFAGVFVNIKGRIDLGKNWANQIKIYEKHTLVNRGVYKIVRHPLYASLIWIFYGACLVYLNFPALLANTFIFIPFMFYRANQEEILLQKEFPEYKNYKLKTGMFFPKL